MNSNEVKNLCINGSRIYLDYLTENDKGRSEIGIHSVAKVQKAKGVYKLELSGRIFEIDAIVFLHKPSRKEFDTNIIKIREYDYDRGILFIKVDGSLPFDFETVRTDDLVVVSDLKFLVKRVIDFFVRNGNRIEVPTVSSDTKVSLSSFSFLPTHKPSKEQEESLLAIFRFPLVYIWGAPGTGKTQFVLSYSVIKYIQDKKRVIIFAPTNVALEQVLKGVLSITDKAGVSREKILRLGNPSRTFAAAYPEVCEVTGIQKKLIEINKQISIIEKIFGVDETSRDEVRLESLISKANQMNPMILEASFYAQAVKKIIPHLTEKEKELSINQNQIDLTTTSLRDLEKRFTSVWHQMFKIFSSKKTNLEIRIADLQQRYQDLQGRKFSLVQESSELKVKKADLVIKQKTAVERIAALLEQMRNISFFSSAANEIVKTLEISNYKDRISRIDDLIEKQIEEENISAELKVEYSHYPKETLNLKLSELRIQRDKLSKLDTTERIKTVNVVAATFDGFIGRFPEADLTVDHVFIDEAGYANVVKSLSAFIYGKPITLLGDHFQLPPVSELNDLNVSAEMEDSVVWTQSAIFCANVFDRAKRQFILDYQSNSTSISSIVNRMDLKTTHRFGDNLAKVMDDYVYKIGFHSGKGGDHTKIKFIHAPKGNPIRKRDNRNEVLAIKKYLIKHHSDWGATDKSISILAPYNDQIIFLGKEFPDLKKEQKLLTVHKSQGREWDTVVLSVCDTSNMWFTDTTNKVSRGINLINTAVSRAKTELIIVCDYNYWANQRGQLIGALLSVAEEVTLD